MKPPDWRKSPRLFGGRLADLGTQARIRRFPHRGLRRNVKVHIGTFIGICPGAQHYYAQVIEEENPLWNGAGTGDDPKWSGWQYCHDDEDKRGREFRATFSSEASARLWTQDVLDRNFGNRRRYRWVHQLTGMSWRRAPAREGD